MVISIRQIGHTAATVVGPGEREINPAVAFPSRAVADWADVVDQVPGADLRAVIVLGGGALDDHIILIVDDHLGFVCRTAVMSRSRIA